MSLRFAKMPDGRRQVTIDGITYTATYYPPCNGMRGYWTVRESPTDYDYDQGENWFESSWTNVRSGIESEAARRRRLHDFS